MDRKVINLDASIAEAKITSPDTAPSQSRRREPAIAVAPQATWQSVAGKGCQEESIKLKEESLKQRALEEQA